MESPLKELQGNLSRKPVCGFRRPWVFVFLNFWGSSRSSAGPPFACPRPYRALQFRGFWGFFVGGGFRVSGLLGVLFRAFGVFRLLGLWGFRVSGLLGFLGV